MYKYPYIPKEYYAAVMFACKMIRNDGYFNKAVNTAAKYYHVDASEVAYHVRARQSAGQEGASKGRKYSWYIIATITQSCEGSQSHINGISYEKATSLENAQKHISGGINGNSYYALDTFAAPLTDKAFSTEYEAYGYLHSDEGDKAYQKLKERFEY